MEAEGKFMSRKRVTRKRLGAQQCHIEARYRGIQILQVDHRCFPKIPWQAESGWQRRSRRGVAQVCA
jgi:hypothetical protein